MNSFEIADEILNFFCNKCINVFVCRIEVKAKSLVPFVCHTYVFKKQYFYSFHCTNYWWTLI